MTKVLAVAASARRDGNSDAVLEQALEGIRWEAPQTEVEMLVPYGLPITPCRSCNACRNTGRCVVQDKMQEVYLKFSEAEHVVVASPIYFTSVPGHFKVLIDRFQCFWSRTYRLGKPPTPRRTGMFLCVAAGDSERYYKSTLALVRAWMSTFNMGCPVSRFYGGLDEKGDVLRREDYLKDARQAGAELIQLARAKAGR